MGINEGEPLRRRPASFSKDDIGSGLADLAQGYVGIGLRPENRYRFAQEYKGLAQRDFSPDDHTCRVKTAAMFTGCKITLAESTDIQSADPQQPSTYTNNVRQAPREEIKALVIAFAQGGYKTEEVIEVLITIGIDTTPLNPAKPSAQNTTDIASLAWSLKEQGLSRIQIAQALSERLGRNISEAQVIHALRKKRIEEGLGKTQEDMKLQKQIILSKIRDAVEKFKREHPNEPLNKASLARELGLTPRHFGKLYGVIS